MPHWQLALAVFVAGWGLQALGSYVQMRHFGATVNEVSSAWPDGFLGAGIARSLFRPGVILLLVVSPDRVVRRALVMRGRTVFARFTKLPAVEGKALGALAGDRAFLDAAIGRALLKATQQINLLADRTRSAQRALGEA